MRVKINTRQYVGTFSVKGVDSELGRHSYVVCNEPTMVPPAESRDQPERGSQGRPEPLTVDVHRAADVGAAQGVGHLAGDGLREVRVVHGGPVHLPRGFLDDLAPLGPPATQALGLVWTSCPGGRMHPTRWKMRPGEGQGVAGPRGVPWGSLHSGVTSGAREEVVGGGWWALGCGSPGSQQHLTDGLFWREVG